MGVISVAAHPAFADLPGVIEVSVEDGRRGLAFLREHGGMHKGPA
jgi:GTPase involved in cell partitioning and DNA repair